jgi:hypothetical protein
MVFINLKEIAASKLCVCVCVFFFFFFCSYSIANQLSIFFALAKFEDRRGKRRESGNSAF